MIRLRESEKRGRAALDWLDSYHTFSFGDYYDPAHMHFRSLRVINEDWVKPGQGFHPHSHQDMEIITYVLEGELEHQDSLGNGSVIRPGEIQRMSAGTGITHSEFNHSKEETLHLLQIWILPQEKNLAPGYEQKSFDCQNLKNQWQLIASKSPGKEAVKIHQDVELFVSFLDFNRELDYALRPNRNAWVQVARGQVNLNGLSLKAGDGAGVSDETKLVIKAKEDQSEILLFDLA